jgi:hypothetical protein
VAPHLEEREKMVVIIIVRNDVRDQWRVADLSQHRSSEQSAVEAMTFPVTQDSEWAPVPLFLAVFDGVEKSLDA